MKTAKFSTSSFIKTSFCILALAGASQSVSADVKFRIGYQADTDNYVVYMAPQSLPSPDRSISSQVTIAVPHMLDTQRFAVSNIVSLVDGAIWNNHSRIDAPVESPYNDFLSFGFNFSSSTVPNFNWVVGQETPVFSFKNPNGGCVDGVRLLDNGEAFNKLPNSKNTNPGNEFTNLGWTTGYSGNYGTAINCQNLGAPVVVPVAPEPAPVVTTPAPVDPTPVPVTPEPTPAPVDPAPVVTTPAPVDPTPVPVTPEPTPAPVDPAPVVTTPAPVDPTPVPVTPEPTPVPVEPTPVVTTPAPVDPTPVPVTPEPTPVPVDPAPVVTTPAPVDPTPVPVTPEPTPVPVEPTPVVTTPAPVTPEPTPVPTPVVPAPTPIKEIKDKHENSGKGKWHKPVKPVKVNLNTFMPLNLSWFSTTMVTSPVVKTTLVNNVKLPSTSCNPVAAATAKKMLADIDAKLANPKLGLLDRFMLTSMRQSIARLAC